MAQSARSFKPCKSTFAWRCLIQRTFCLRLLLPPPKHTGRNGAEPLSRKVKVGSNHDTNPHVVVRKPKTAGRFPQRGVVTIDFSSSSIAQGRMGLASSTMGAASSSKQDNSSSDLTQQDGHIWGRTSLRVSGGDDGATWYVLLYEE